MQYIIVRRDPGTTAKIVSMFRDRDEALGEMEDMVRLVLMKKNGEDASSLRYYQFNDVRELSAPKSYGRFPLMDVDRFYNECSSEWAIIPNNSYFCVRCAGDLFKLICCYKQDCSSIFRSSYKVEKLFEVELVVNSFINFDEFSEENSYYEEYPDYDPKCIESAIEALSNEDRDVVINSVKKYIDDNKKDQQNGEGEDI